jgi:hypothetical protein
MLNCYFFFISLLVWTSTGNIDKTLATRGNAARRPMNRPRAAYSGSPGRIVQPMANQWTSVADPERDTHHFTGSASFYSIRIILQDPHHFTGSASFYRIRIIFTGSASFYRIRIILQDPHHFTGSWSFYRIRIILQNPHHFTGSASFYRIRIRIILQDPDQNYHRCLVRIYWLLRFI